MDIKFNPFNCLSSSRQGKSKDATGLLLPLLCV